MEVLESLIGAVRRCCAGFPDRRTGTNGRYPMPDIGMGAFSLFFVPCRSRRDRLGQPQQLGRRCWGAVAGRPTRSAITCALTRSRRSGTKTEFWLVLAEA